MNAEICSLGFAIVFVPAVILGWLQILDYLRMRRVRRLYASLPVASRDQFLNQIDEAGRPTPACTVLVAVEPEQNRAADDLVSSRYGGQPYAEAGETWPLASVEKPEPADFLIQVRLDDSLPPPWPGRLVVVFNRFDVEQTARCYAEASIARAAALAGGPAPQREWGLRAVRIPKQPAPEPAADVAGAPVPHDGGLLDYDPVVLLKTVPQLKEQMAQQFARPADLLAAILAPNHCGYGFELSDIVQLGGRPVWLLEDPGEQTCPRCSQGMRFLFQFGDLNRGIMLGDSGVCYVFGCDSHPEHPVAIAQMC